MNISDYFTKVKNLADVLASIGACHNPTLREVRGRHSNSQKWDLGVFQDSLKLGAQLQGPKHLAM